jgi:hypothetical protein
MILKFATMLVLCFPLGLSAQSLKPLSTEFVDCVQDQRGAYVASNKQRTPSVKSSVGSISYGEVSAELLPGGSCQTTSTVYVAESNGPFRPVLRQGLERLADGSVYDGSGVAYLSWSPSGSILLAVLFQWTNGTDGGGNYQYFVIQRGETSAKLIFPEDAVWKEFKHPCSALISFNGWIDDQRIGLEVRPFIWHDEEGNPDPTPACIKEATTFSFDLVTQAVTRASANDFKVN